MKHRTRMDILRVILLGGCTAALGVWLTAPAPAADPLGDPLDNSKIYERNIEMVGGKANLVASQITDGLKSMLHGKPLALTLAVLTVLAAGGFMLVTEDDPPAA